MGVTSTVPPGERYPDKISKGWLKWPRYSSRYEIFPDSPHPAALRDAAHCWAGSQWYGRRMSDATKNVDGRRYICRHDRLRFDEVVLDRQGKRRFLQDNRPVPVRQFVLSHCNHNRQPSHVCGKSGRLSLCAVAYCPRTGRPLATSKSNLTLV